MDAFAFVSAKLTWEVFLLFAIPIGGGIPAGAIVAHKNGMSWAAMSLLYFLSDIMLAILFEPAMRLVVHASKKSSFLMRLREAFAMTTNKTIARYGPSPGPFTLVAIAFGVDPMTGRAVGLMDKKFNPPEI